MNISSMDTLSVSDPLNLYDENEAPTTPIPEVHAIGNRPALEAESDEVLTAKFEEYAAAAPIVVEHHNYQRDRFDTIYATYTRIFTALDTLESIQQTTEASVPGLNLLEEFELFDLPENIARFNAIVGKVTLVAGGVTAVIGAFKAVQHFRTASQTLTAAQGKPIGAKRPASVIKGAKAAKGWKVLGAIGAGITVGTSIVGIIATIENNRRRRAFLVDSVETYQSWYTQTVQSVDDMCSGSDDMEAALVELMELLGVETTDDLEAVLGGSVQVAGEVQASVRSAKRMLCSTDPVINPGQVAIFTGLPPITVTRIATMIAEDPTICTIEG